jgi:uncharacterized protein YvpB
MQKTYTTSLVKKTTDEIQQTTADLIDDVKQQAWQQIVATFKTQSDCEHLTVQYHTRLQKVSCSFCSTFSIDFDKLKYHQRNFVDEYKELTNPHSTVVIISLEF